MSPLSFPDKRTALLAAFTSRFSLGFFAAAIKEAEDPVFQDQLSARIAEMTGVALLRRYEWRFIGSNARATSRVKSPGAASC